MLRLSNITKTYPQAKAPALRGVSLEVAEGEFVCLIGPSGCGKSTLLKIIAGLEAQSAGARSAPSEVSMVFQSAALLPWLSAADNVALGLHASTASREHTVREQLSLVGLSELAQRYPRELSGGQRQRVGLARALAVAPKLLLLDEPFSALDPKTTHDLHEDILRIWREQKLTIVMISHLIEEAVSLADRVILMRDGTIAETFPLKLPYPRRENGLAFHEEVQKIRKAFFA